MYPCAPAADFPTALLLLLQRQYRGIMRKWCIGVLEGRRESVLVELVRCLGSLGVGSGCGLRQRGLMEQARDGWYGLE